MGSYNRFEEDTGEALKRKAKVIGVLGGFAVLALFGLSLLFGSWYRIDQGERGVVLRNGALHAVAQPGLNFKLPIIDSVHDITVQTNTYRWQKMNAYSADQQPADLNVSVTLKIDPAKVSDVYAEYGSVEGAVSRLVQPVVNRDVKIVFGNYTAVRAIQQRGKLNAEAKTAITEALADSPLIVESVQIENIDYSPEYIKSVEQRMQAEVEVDKLKQNAEREKVQAQITVTKATAEADATRQRAQAEAEAITLRGNAEARAIDARGKALRDNPMLVGLVQAERWDGKLPTTMVPGGALPMINMGTTPR